MNVQWIPAYSVTFYFMYLFVCFIILSKSYEDFNKYIEVCFILSLEAARYSVVLTQNTFCEIL
jgi:hypothetical protein